MLQPEFKFYKRFHSLSVSCVVTVLRNLPTSYLSLLRTLEFEGLDLPFELRKELKRLQMNRERLRILYFRNPMKFSGKGKVSQILREKYETERVAERN